MSPSLQKCRFMILKIFYWSWEHLAFHSWVEGLYISHPVQSEKKWSVSIFHVWTMKRWRLTLMTIYKTREKCKPSQSHVCLFRNFLVVRSIYTALKLKYLNITKHDDFVQWTFITHMKWTCQSPLMVCETLSQADAKSFPQKHCDKLCSVHSKSGSFTMSYMISFAGLHSKSLCWTITQ